MAPIIAHVIVLLDQARLAQAFQLCIYRTGRVLKQKAQPGAHGPCLRNALLGNLAPIVTLGIQGLSWLLLV